MVEVQHSDLNPRTSKRFTYLAQAHFEIQNVRYVVQIRDISKSGVQFFSNIPIQKNIPLVLTWQDPKIGNIVSHVMIVRDIKQTAGFFRFCYGSKFVNLKQEAKQDIDKLISNADTDEIEANKELLNVITSEFLIDMIMQGRLYLKNVVKETSSSKAGFRFINEFRDYEKQAFEKNGEPFQWIQKLTTQVFHCNLLNATVPLIEKEDSRISEIYKLMTNKLESITFLIAETRRYMDSLPAKDMHEHEKINFRTHLTESINRLIYKRHQLLETLTHSRETERNLPTVKF